MSRLRRLAVFLPVVGGAIVGALRHGAVGLLAGAAVGLLVWFSQWRFGLVSRSASAVSSGLGRLLAWLVVLVVLPGRRVDPPTGWLVRPDWAGASRAMGSPPPFPRRRIRFRWLLLAVLWADFAGGMLAHGQSNPDGKVSSANRYEASGVDDPALKVLQADAERFVFQPYGEVGGVPLWTLSPGRTGSLVFDPETGRRTYRAAVAVDAPTVFRVAVVGASAAFGMGADDEATVPSEIAKGLERAGVPAVVGNYAMPGFVAEQSVVDLRRRLEAGERFDAVVLLTGFNDVFLSLYGADGPRFMSDGRFLAPSPRSWLAWWSDRSLTSFLIGHRRVFDEPPMRRYGGSEHAFLDPEADAASTAATSRLVAALTEFNDLADRYGFRPVYAWTPSWVESPGEPSGTGGDISEGVRLRWAEVFSSVRERVAGAVGELMVLPDPSVYGKGCFFDMTHHVGRCSALLAGPVLDELLSSASTSPVPAPSAFPVPSGPSAGDDEG